ncbi:MAG: sugar isomerase [Actinomycetota bacterium]|nr:sugar isomerase [Actinomycetota bacterium]
MTGARYTRAEIASQPDCWAQAAARADELPAGLPRAGDAALVIGCGTSLYVAQAYAGLREAAGQGRTDARPASEVDRQVLSAGYDTVLAISRSGTTTEVRSVLSMAPEGLTALAITAVSDSPIAQAVPAPVVLDFADERSVVQTRFATSVVALLRRSTGADLGPVIADGRQALTGELPPLLDSAGGPAHVVFLARGWAIGLAAEAALKCRESAGAHSEAYPAREYRHGPISIAGPQTLVWALSPIGFDLVTDIEATGATVEQGRLDPLAELVRAQRWAVAAADRAGLDADLPRHLTRSVVLAGERP